MRAVFVQLQCVPGKTYEVADQLFEREVASELYSTSGEYDLLMKIYIEPEVDIGKFINENVGQCARHRPLADNAHLQGLLTADAQQAKGDTR